MGIVEKLRQDLVSELEAGLAGNYNELTEILKLKIIELLKTKYCAAPVENDPSCISYCQIGAIYGEHYPVSKMNYSAWVSNTSTKGWNRGIENPTLEQALSRRQREIEHSKKTKTRITYDMTVIFSNNVMYLVEGGGKANPVEFEDFVAQAGSDIEKLLIGIVKVKDAFKFCDRIYPPDTDLSLRIDDDIIEGIYKLGGKGIEFLINKKMSKPYIPPPGVEEVQNLAA